MSQDYPYIRAWCHMMGSYDYYVTDQVKRARETNAPPTALFQRHAPDGSGPTGEWAVFEGITDPLTRAQVEKLVLGCCT